MNTLTHAPTSTFGSGLLSLTLKPLVKHFQRRKTLAQLNDLDDRMLRDIGLNRFDVEAMRRLF